MSISYSWLNQTFINIIELTDVLKDLFEKKN